jgi:ribonuclease HI
MTLAEHSRVQLMWVPGHKGIPSDKIADLLAKQGAKTLFAGSEHACIIPGGDVRGLQGTGGVEST